VAGQSQAVSSAGSCEKATQGNDDLVCILGHAEVWPLKVLAWPGRLPTAVEIKPKVRGIVSPVGVHGIEGKCHHRGAIGQDDDRMVGVHFESLVQVGGVEALGGFTTDVPLRLALGAHH
jgi:hypothetical protein